MRKITENAVYNFLNDTEYHSSNTEVSVYKKLNKTFMMLHGSIIAKKTKSGIFVSNAGYETNTTKERLNGLLQMIGANAIKQKDFVWYIGEKEMPSNKFVKVRK